MIYAFQTIGLFLYPLKTTETQKFSEIFRRYRKIPVTWNGIKTISYLLPIYSIVFSIQYHITIIKFLFQKLHETKMTVAEIPSLKIITQCINELRSCIFIDNIV